MATIRNIAFIGDSTTEGEVGLYSYFEGGTGSYVERYAAMYAKWSGTPLLGFGFRGLWHILFTTEFSITSGSWATTTTTDAFCRGLFAYARYASTGDIISWNRPSQISTAGGFAIYWIDMAGGGNWQYRVDGGAWTNMNQSPTGDNGLKKFYVTTAVVTSVEIRAHNGTSNVGCCIAGIEPYRLDPRSNSGVIVHNLGYSGNFLGVFVEASSGDVLAWFDSVALGTNAVSHKPDEIFVSFTNDYQAGTSTDYGNNLTTLLTRTSFARRNVWGFPEQNGKDLTGVTTVNGSQAITATSGNFTQTDVGLAVKGTQSPFQTGTLIDSVTNGTTAHMSKTATGANTTAYLVRSPAGQSAYRSQAQTTAAAMGAKYVDLAPLWAKTYGGTAGDGTSWAAANTAGLMYDGLHQSGTGHAEIAMRLWWAFGPRVVS